jgi:hypothetical protein
MKLRALRVRSLVWTAVGLLALNAPLRSTAAENKASPSLPGKAAADVSKKAEDDMGKVEGVEVKRSSGTGYFGVELVNGNFKITFYDAKRKVIAAPMNRAALRWPVNYRPADERTVLNLSGDGKSLTSAKVVKQPYQFKLYITFLADGADESGPGSESYVVDFRA